MAYSGTIVPGSPILAAQWNALVDDLESHTHSGAPDAGRILSLVSVRPHVLTPAHFADRDRYEFAIPVRDAPYSFNVGPGVAFPPGVVSTTMTRIAAPWDYAGGGTVTVLLSGTPASGSPALLRLELFRGGPGGPYSAGSAVVQGTAVVGTAPWLWFQGTIPSGFGAGQLLTVNFSRIGTASSDKRPGTVYCHGFKFWYRASM